VFSFPVTVPVRRPDSIEALSVWIDIDKIAVVKSLLDKVEESGVESDFYSLLPATEILLDDGRKLPVVEPVEEILRYLDAYRELDLFFTGGPPMLETREGNVIPLFKVGPCASLAGSTPA
jgi:hypothetical protein